MIRGIGIDAVSILRMETFGDGLVSRLFHPSEAKRALMLKEDSLRSRGEFLATRFAAKEALSKAMGTGMRGMSLREIAVVTDILGKPSLVLEGHTAEHFSRLFPKTSILVSLTHEHPLALAQVMLVEESSDGTQ
ncbi:holo-ACP synthase [Parasphaerochaeta coccoides]|uniref:Holo-[acyl-carrier-protein] synthase n=1 Tax=Parasphaerochaeta coccoides (strain ATCC BAA-1237 / DSM 17374 / SPN1) TaxID=760011 RepID=F4GI59_PARC1|nr:holo-ACP synthase [Parasphaerochaeta coccoides]AEC02657.1 Holo-(acyl-carrier-protein) synthase [Parasphaerochaeta coccoides DSM 17374]